MRTGVGISMRWCWSTGPTFVSLCDTHAVVSKTTRHVFNVSALVCHRQPGRSRWSGLHRTCKI